MSTMKPGLVIMHTEGKGRGVFTFEEIHDGDIVENAHVIVLSLEDRAKIHGTELHNYYFLWGEDQLQAAIALGYGSLYNHSETPNLDYILDYDDQTIEFFAIRDIKIGEELSINYRSEKIEKYPLWFDVV